VTGPGTVVLQAGRDVVLGQGETASGNQLLGGAVYSMGNGRLGFDLSGPNGGTAVPTINTALPAGKAANIVIVAGAPGPAQAELNAARLTAAYLDPSNATQRGVHDYLPALRAYMKGLDPSNATLSETELVAAFSALPLVRRQLFLNQVYFTELKETGIDYNDSKSPRFHSYDRGFHAVALLFPTDPSTPRSGDVILAGKAVETRASGDITILAPYGGVQVGTAIVPKFFDEGVLGGVVTRRGGDIRIMSDQDIALFTSRVFTLQGGDITMWTSNGGVSAGAGSKTSVFQRPLAYTMTSTAAVEVDAFGLSTGAGIGVLDALGNAEGRPPSRLDIVAPHGEVDAGDAGIRVVGDINIAAAVVAGVENIQVSGVSTGVPKAEAPNIGALTTAAQVAQGAAQEGVGPDARAAQQAAQEARTNLPSIITVEVVGYESPDGEQDQERKRKKPGRPEGTDAGKTPARSP